MRPILIAAVSAILIASPAFAAPLHLKIDPAASKVTTVVAEPDRTKGFATAKFTITSGDVSGDPSNPGSGSSLTIVLDAKSYDSGNGFRDDAVYGMLDADNYPTITFQSTGVEQVTMGAGNSGSANLVGNLTIHGKTKPVTLPVKASLDATNHLTADGEVTFNYADFGVRVPSMMGMTASDQVTVQFHIVAAPG